MPSIYTFETTVHIYGRIVTMESFEVDVVTIRIGIYIERPELLDVIPVCTQRQYM